MKVEISEANYRRLLELKEMTDADSIDEVLAWLLDFWFSWSERESDFEFRFDS